MKVYGVISDSGDGSSCLLFCKDLELKHVPVYIVSFTPDNYDREYFLKLADGLSVINNTKKRREGLVFKCNESTESFKAVSNLYLLECK